MGLFLREARSFCNFFRESNREARALTFYSEHRVYGRFLETLIDALMAHSDLKMCYVTSDHQDPFFKKSNERFKVFYVKQLLPLLIVLLDARALIMTMPDIQQFHVRRSMRGAHHFYLFHAMMSTHMVYRKGAFDHYDSLLCVGPHHKQEIRAWEALHGFRPKNLLEGGYPLLDKIYQDHQAYLKSNPSPMGRKRTVLIAPSWAPHNIILSCITDLVRSLTQHEYHVIVRPHPEFLKRRNRQAQALLNMLSRFEGVELELNPTTSDSLHIADVLITDWSGIGLEFAFGTERPVLYMDTPRKVNNPDYVKLGIEPVEVILRSQIGRLLTLDDSTKVHEAVADLLERRSYYQQEIVHARQKYVYHFGTSAVKSAEHLIHFLKTA